MRHYIYKITFLCGNHKGDYYIGKRSSNYKKKDFYAGSGKFCKSYYNKYGRIEGTTYTKEILEFNESKDINAQREKQIIGNLYKSDPHCMNMMAGGKSGYNSRELLVNKFTGESVDRHHSEETKAKLREYSSKHKANLGKKFDTEWKEALAKAHRKPINCFDLNGNFIKHYPSVKSVTEDGFNKGSVNRVLKGKYPSNKGYIFRYV